MLANPNPLRQIETLLEQARRAGGPDPTAHVLATATAGGQPSARYVLLKGIDERGLVFFTNRRSRKAAELAENPHAAACFFWPSIGVEARVQGSVASISGAESDAYFATRPRWSQLGAWASKQSTPLRNRLWLLARGAYFAVRFFGRRVRRPPHWGGYRLAPTVVELLLPRERVRFTRESGAWTEVRSEEGGEPPR